MQICQLEHYGVPVWSVNPLTKNLLVRITYFFINFRPLVLGQGPQLSRAYCAFQATTSTRV